MFKKKITKKKIARKIFLGVTGIVAAVGLFMGTNIDELKVNAAAPSVTLSTSSLSYSWTETGTKSFKVNFKNCDYCTVNISSGNFATINKSRVNSTGGKVNVTVDSQHRNPNAGTRTEKIVITPVVNGAAKSANAMTLVVKQAGHGYTERVFNTKSDVVGGWVPNYGVCSYTYTLTYLGYYKNSGNNRIFGKHVADIEISRTKNCNETYYDPAKLKIKNGGDVVKSYTLVDDFANGESFMRTGNASHTFTRVCYAELTLPKNTSYKSYFAGSIKTGGSIEFGFSLTTKLSK